MPNLKAKELRRAATDAERKLWSLLRSHSIDGYKFRRQHPIGPYIADFACWEKKLIVEADGGQHADNLADERRTAWLHAQGWTVIRFWNDEILKNSAVVYDEIVRALKA
jgi:very-short-patch-repair endonuclease